MIETTTFTLNGGRIVVYALPDPGSKTLEVLVWWRREEEKAWAPNTTGHTFEPCAPEEIEDLVARSIRNRNLGRVPKHRALCSSLDGTRILTRWEAWHAPCGSVQHRLMWGELALLHVEDGPASVEIHHFGPGAVIKVRDENGALTRDWQEARRFAVLWLSATDMWEISPSLLAGEME